MKIIAHLTDWNQLSPYTQNRWVPGSRFYNIKFRMKQMEIREKICITLYESKFFNIYLNFYSFHIIKFLLAWSSQNYSHRNRKDFLGTVSVNIISSDPPFIKFNSQWEIHDLSFKIWLFLFAFPLKKWLADFLKKKQWKSCEK